MEKATAIEGNSSTMSPMNSGGIETPSLVVSDSLSMDTNLQLLNQKLNGKNYVERVQSVKLMLLNFDSTRMQNTESSTLAARGQEPKGEKKK